MSTTDLDSFWSRIIRRLLIELSARPTKERKSAGVREAGTARMQTRRPSSGEDAVVDEEDAEESAEESWTEAVVKVEDDLDELEVRACDEEREGKGSEEDGAAVVEGGATCR
jgi:hypothetical protein